MMEDNFGTPNIKNTNICLTVKSLKAMRLFIQKQDELAKNVAKSRLTFMLSKHSSIDTTYRRQINCSYYFPSFSVQQSDGSVKKQRERTYLTAQKLPSGLNFEYQKKQKNIPIRNYAPQYPL